MKLEDKKNFIVNIAYFFIIGAMMYYFVKYALVWLLPFVIGFGVAFALKPMIIHLSEKLRLPRKIIAGILVLLFYAVLAMLIALLGVRLFAVLRAAVLRLPMIFTQSIDPAINTLFDNIERLIAGLDPILVAEIDNLGISLSSSIGSILSKASSVIMHLISSTITSLPGFLLIVLFTVISSFFFAFDYQKITSFVVRQFPDRFKEILFIIKDYIVGTIFKLIKAYSILMFVTFVELFIGLSILGIKNAIGVAVLIAIVDILPVLGTGTVVIPWALIELVKGNIPLAIGLLFVYLIITLVRNILEPKVVGEQIGLHPVLMLMCIFLGARIFGLLGLFLLPIIMIVIIKLNRTGKIRIFRHSEREE